MGEKADVERRQPLHDDVAQNQDQRYQRGHETGIYQGGGQPIFGAPPAFHRERPGGEQHDEQQGGGEERRQPPGPPQSGLRGQGQNNPGRAGRHRCPLRQSGAHERGRCDSGRRSNDRGHLEHRISRTVAVAAARVDGALTNRMRFLMPRTPSSGRSPDGRSSSRPR